MSNKYLNEGDFDVILNMSIPFTDIFHDEITQFATELHPGRATSNNNTMQEAFPFFLRYA